jgi:hypothetical protein
VDIRLKASHGVLLLSALVFLAAAIPLRALPAASYDRIVAARYPVAAVAYIEREQLKGPMWNDFGWGSWLISALPRLPVLVDGRAELYGDAFLRDYMDTVRGRMAPSEAFDRFGVTLALVAPKSTLAAELRREPDWTEAFHDDVAAVFVRR